MQSTRYIKKQLTVFERTARWVSYKFTVHPVMVLLDKCNSEMQNGFATAESCVCIVELRGLNLWLKCKDITIWNMEDKHLEDSP